MPAKKSSPSSWLRHHMFALVFALVGIAILVFAASQSTGGLFSFAKGKGSSATETSKCLTSCYDIWVTHYKADGKTPQNYNQCTEACKTSAVWVDPNPNAEFHKECPAGYLYLGSCPSCRAWAMNAGAHENSCVREDLVKSAKNIREALGTGNYYDYTTSGVGGSSQIKPTSKIESAPSQKSKTTTCTPVCGTYYGVKYCRTVCK